MMLCMLHNIHGNAFTAVAVNIHELDSKRLLSLAKYVFKLPGVEDDMRIWGTLIICHISFNTSSRPWMQKTLVSTATLHHSSANRKWP